MDARAASSRGGWIGLGLLALLALAEAAVVTAARSAGLGPRAAVLGMVAAVLVPAIILVAYWVWGYYSLRYSVSRDGIVVRWAASRHVIPMDAITHVLAGRPFAAPLTGLRWPGYAVGRTVIRDDDDHPRETLVHATAPPDTQLVVVTPSLAYALSPADRVGFIEAFKARRRLGPAQTLVQHTEQAAWARLGVLRDPWAARLLAAGAVACALGFALVAWRWPSLPDMLPITLRYDPLLMATMPSPPQPVETLWRLPWIGLAAFLLNTLLAAAVHGRARLGAVLLAGGALAVQILLIVVLIRVT